MKNLTIGFLLFAFLLIGKSLLAQDRLFQYFAPEGTRWKMVERDALGYTNVFYLQLGGDVNISGKDYVQLRVDGKNLVYAYLRLDSELNLYYRDINGNEVLLYNYETGLLNGENIIDYYIVNGVVNYTDGVDVSHNDNVLTQWEKGVGPVSGFGNLYVDVFEYNGNADELVCVYRQDMLLYSNETFINCTPLSSAPSTNTEQLFKIWNSQNTLKIYGVNSLESNYDIYSILGNKLKHGKFTRTANVDISDLPSGTYIVHINNKSVKFLK